MMGRQATTTRKKLKCDVDSILENLLTFYRSVDRASAKQSLIHLNQIEENVIKYHDTVYRMNSRDDFYEKLQPQTIGMLRLLNEERENLLIKPNS